MEKTINLANLPINQSAHIVKLNCEGTIRRRMLDLGMIPGTSILPVLKSPSGDPRAFEVRGSTIALRKEDACLIEVSL